MASIKLPGGLALSYTYDAQGNLTNVSYPDATLRAYQYANKEYPRAMTGLVDENGVLFAKWAYDADGRAISSEHAGGAKKVTLVYKTVTGGSGTTTEVTDALGQLRSFGYKVIQGRTMHVGTTGGRVRPAAAALQTRPTT